MLTRISDHGRLVEFGAGQLDDERLADLAEPLVGHADDSGLRHAVQACQHLFDLGGVHVESAADVHVLEPVGDLQIPGVVDSADIAGVQPAVGVDGVGRRLGIVEIAQHHVGPAQQHFACAVFGWVVDAQLEVGDRSSARGGDGDGVVVGAAHRAEAAGLGQPVRRQHDVDVQLRLHPLDQNHRDRRRAGDRESQRAQVVVAAFGMVEQCLVDRRGSGQHGDPVLGHCGHRLLRVERQLRDERGPGLQTGQDARLVAEVMEERVDTEVAVGAGDLPARRPRRGRVQRLPVCAQRALAAARRAGGEQDVGNVVGPDRGRAAVDRIQVRAAGDELVPGAVVLVDRNAHDVPQVGQRSPIQVGGLVSAEEFTGRDQQRRPGAGQHVGGFARGVAGVEGDDHAACVVGGQARDDPVPGVRRPDRDAVSGGDAEVDHRRGGSADLVAQLRVGQPSVSGGIAGTAGGGNQRVVVGELVGNPVQDLRDGPQIGGHRCSSNKASAW